MKKLVLFLGVLLAIGVSSCNRGNRDNVLLSRTFPTASWERFDFVKNDIEVKKAASYDLVLQASFDTSYTYDHLSVVFTIFDAYGNPFRAKAYQFRVKDKDGQWKSTLVDGCYHFSFPINNEITINEPGMYTFQLENHMPITPLYGIKEIALISNK